MRWGAIGRPSTGPQSSPQHLRLDLTPAIRLWHRNCTNSGLCRPWRHRGWPEALHSPWHLQSPKPHVCRNSRSFHPILRVLPTPLLSPSSSSLPPPRLLVAVTHRSFWLTDLTELKCLRKHECEYLSVGFKPSSSGSSVTLPGLQFLSILCRNFPTAGRRPWEGHGCGAWSSLLMVARAG